MTAEEGRRLAVFDIDGTLVPGQSTERLFYRHLLRNNHQGPLQWARYAHGLLKWAPRHGRHTLKKNKAYLTGLYASQVSSLAEKWVQQTLRAEMDNEVISRLNQHQAAGDYIALLSGTPDFLAAAIGEVLGADRHIGSDCRIEDGVFVFKPIGRHPFREEKLTCTMALAGDTGISLDDTVAYGDSIHDLPLLERVGRPIAVHPDRKLAEIARQRGWEIIR